MSRLDYGFMLVDCQHFGRPSRNTVPEGSYCMWICPLCLREFRCDDGQPWKLIGHMFPSSNVEGDNES